MIVIDGGEEDIIKELGIVIEREKVMGKKKGIVVEIMRDIGEMGWDEKIELRRIIGGNKKEDWKERNLKEERKWILKIKELGKKVDMKREEEE